MASREVDVVWGCTISSFLNLFIVIHFIMKDEAQQAVDINFLTE